MIRALTLTVVISGLFVGCGDSNCFSSQMRDLDAQCKSLEVKASPNDAQDKRMIEVYYSIIPSSSKSDKDPIVFLTGGPGPSNTFMFDNAITEDEVSYVSQDRDIIVMDYRGTGFSNPYPKCDALFFDGGLLDERAVESCFATLEKLDISTSDYTSANIAYDLNKILEYEKIQKVVLIGYSYGTRVASTMARDYSDKVSAMVLDGLFSIEANGISQASESILDKLNDLGRAYDIEYSDDNFRKRLETLSTTMDNQAFNDLLTSTLPNQAYLTGGVHIAKYIFDNNGILEDEDTSYVQVLPRSISEDVGYKINSTVMALGIIMIEEFNFIKQQPAFGFGFGKGVRDALKNFQGGAPLSTTSLASIKQYFPNTTDNIEMKPLKTDIPTMILTGGLDQQTTKYWAVNSQKHLTNSKHFFFPLNDHVVSMGNNNANTLIANFLNGYDDLNAMDNFAGDDFIELKK